MRLLTLVMAAVLLLGGGAFAEEGKSATLDLGQVKISALKDAENMAPLSAILTPASLEKVKGSIAADGEVKLNINAYLLRMNGKNILIDTGLGAEQGGQLLQALNALDIAPEMIDMVVMTHLHIDHAGGLYGEGKEVFGNAQVWVAEDEARYWGEEKEFPALQQGSIPFARAALKVSNLRLYAPGIEIMPGLTSIAAYGHTPGHTAFMVNAGEKQVLIWGDAMHVPGLQFAFPDVQVVYDVDADAAQTVRQDLLQMASEQGLIVAGMHLPFPGWGMVEKPEPADEKAAYKFVPLD